MPRSARFTRVALIALLALVVPQVAGCSQVAPKVWTKGSGPVKILASTNVWGSIAHLVAGRSATVSALIANVNQDPHSFEATARDQLLVNNADVIVLNGGGYDDFMLRMIAADPTPAKVVNAFQATGNDKNRNEHIWYSVPQVRVAAKAIASSVRQTLEAQSAGSVNSLANQKLRASLQSSMTRFDSELQKREQLLSKLKASRVCGRVFATEPLIDYLLADAGCVNVTPTAFSRAIEEERDVSPKTLKQAKALLINGIDFVAYNYSVSSSQIEALLSHQNAKRGILGFNELLEQDPDTLEYYGDYLTLLDDAIKSVEGKF